MKRAWFQRIRGGGCQTLVMGEKPMFCNFCCFTTFFVCHLLSHPTLSTSLMLQLVVGGVIAEVVVVVAGCQPYPIVHSTHVCPFFSLTHSSLVSSLSPRFLVLFSPHAQVLGRFWSHAGFLPLPHELLSTHELKIHVLPLSGASTGKNGFVFPHAGPPLSVIFLAGSDCLPTHKNSSVWGAHSELRAVLLHP